MENQVCENSLSGACHKDVAASTSRCHAGLSIACRLAVARPKLSGRRSSSTVLSQVCLGLPVLRRQSLGGPRMQARRAREWSWPVSARHRRPKKDKCRWRIVSDRSGCPVRDRTTHWRQQPSNGYGGCAWDTNYPVHLSSSLEYYYDKCRVLGTALLTRSREALYNLRSGSWLASIVRASFIFSQNAQKCVWWPGSTRTLWGANSALTDLLAGLKGRGGRMGNGGRNVWRALTPLCIPDLPVFENIYRGKIMRRFFLDRCNSSSGQSVQRMVMLSASSSLSAAAAAAADSAAGGQHHWLNQSASLFLPSSRKPTST